MESHISIRLPSFKSFNSDMNKENSHNHNSSLETVEVLRMDFKCEKEEVTQLAEERKQQAKLAADVMLQLGAAAIKMAADKAADLIKATAEAVVDIYDAKASAFAKVAKAVEPAPTKAEPVAEAQPSEPDIGEDGCFKQPHAKPHAK